MQRFLPSEYGCDVELAKQMLEPARSILGAKLRVREAVRAAGIPHTIISSNWSQGFLLPRAGNPEANGPPDNNVTIFGDGKLQGRPFIMRYVTELFNLFHYTSSHLIYMSNLQCSLLTRRIWPRWPWEPWKTHAHLTIVLHLRPQENLCSLDKLVSLWENKIDKTLKKTCVREEELLKKVQGTSSWKPMFVYATEEEFKLYNISLGTSRDKDSIWHLDTVPLVSTQLINSSQLSSLKSDFSFIPLYQ